MENKETTKKSRLSVLVLLAVMSLCFTLYGCGSSSDGGLSDWTDGSRVLRVSNLKGRVIAPLTSGNSRAAESSQAYFSLVSTQGAKVFLEDDPSKSAVADVNGNFVIPNVVEGRHRVVANILSGTTTYRQRSDVIVVTGQYETQEMVNSIALEPALYSLKLHLSDMVTASPVQGKVTIWGYTYEAINGIVDIGPFPAGATSKEASIKALGYRDYNTLLTFGEYYKAEHFISMTPTTSTEPNLAPIVGILPSALEVKTNREINLNAIGVDPEGEAITWKWAASAGSFFNQNSPQSIYTAPNATGTVRISLIGTDAKGAQGKSVIDLVVVQGSSGRDDDEPYNSAPEKPNTPFPEHQSINLAGELLLAWTCKDPDGDPITYSVFFGKDIKEMKEIATGLKEPCFKVSNLAANTKYLWQVTATDNHFAIATSDLWQFTTGKLENHKPSFATIVEPVHKGVEVPYNQKLRWIASDEDNDTLYYDVYFGDTEEPELVSASQTSQIYDPGVLDPNKDYYWRIVVSDGELSNPRSDLWTFKTAEIVDETPEVISITAPNNTNQPLKIVFSEYIDNAKEDEALVLNPSIDGIWKWSSNNTIAEFMPSTGSWYPGHCNNFKLVANLLTDATGNFISSSSSLEFQVPSSVPVPTGYKSSGFPILAPANSSVSVAVPDLDYGKHSYVIAIADSDASSFVVNSFRASIDENRVNSVDPTYSLRLAEARMMSNPIPETPKVLGCAALAAIELESTREFYINPIATNISYPNNKVTATAKALSANTVVYLDNGIADPEAVTQANKVLSIFDSQILQQVRNAFGNEPEKGVDGESRIQILLFNVASGNSTAGYFSSADLYNKDLENKDFRISNEGKIFYIKYGMSEILTFATLAHEFQHMINYYQKNKSLKYTEKMIFEETWLNEALSMYSEEVTGYSLLDGSQNAIAHVRNSMQNANDLSLTTWSDLAYGYGQSYLFMHFLTQPNRYNSDPSFITKSLVMGSNKGLVGEENVEAVTGEPFKETMAKFALSLYLNRYDSTNPQDYGIKDIDLTGTYNGITLPGYTFNNLITSSSLSGLKKNSIRAFRKVSTGNGDTNINVVTGNEAISLWFFDERGTPVP